MNKREAYFKKEEGSLHPGVIKSRMIAKLQKNDRNRTATSDGKASYIKGKASGRSSNTKERIETSRAGRCHLSGVREDGCRTN